MRTNDPHLTSEEVEDKSDGISSVESIAQVGDNSQSEPPSCPGVSFS